MSGGQNLQAKAEVARAIKAAINALTLETKEGMIEAHGTILGALEQAEQAQLAPEQIILFCMLGDLYFSTKKFETAHSAYTDAIHIEGAIGNPKVHYRLGKTNYHLENLDRAADELARAYMGAGKDIFANDGGIYFEFLKTRLKPPPNGW